MIEILEYIFDKLKKREKLILFLLVIGILLEVTGRLVNKFLEEIGDMFVAIGLGIMVIEIVSFVCFDYKKWKASRVVEVISMKPPLKNKRLRIVLSPTGKFKGIKVTKNGDLLHYEDVKLAVKGLLEDLKELEKRWKEKLSKQPEGIQQLYSLQLFAEFENLIKKRFGDFDEK